MAVDTEKYRARVRQCPESLCFENYGLAGCSLDEVPYYFVQENMRVLITMECLTVLFIDQLSCFIIVYVQKSVSFCR